MEYEKVELLGLKDTLEHLLDFIWKMETSRIFMGFLTG